MTATKIQWTDRTWNPWRGCARVSPGCANCYAAAMSRRNPAVLGEWGHHAPRARAAEPCWRLPRAWDRQAAASGTRLRVFCASLADIFEGREDLIEDRARVWRLIQETPNLDWQLLTKQPVTALHWARSHGWPGNAWLGISAETQRELDRRWPFAARVPALVHFISHEPGLKGIRLPDSFLSLGGRGWVITGGESGPKARCYDTDWGRSLIRQCRAAGVPVFVKQLGYRATCARDGLAGRGLEVPAEALPLVSVRLRDPKGGDPSEWPPDLRVRQIPDVTPTWSLRAWSWAEASWVEDGVRQ